MRNLRAYFQLPLNNRDRGIIGYIDMRPVKYSNLY